MKLCIAGKNSIAIEAAKYALDFFDKESIYIITNKTDRGEDTFQPSLLKFARTDKYNAISLEDAYDFDDMLFLSLEYDRLLKPELFRSRNLFNIHFSLLPKYKGMYTSYWPLINGEKESGVTLHRIESGIDTGNIISQISFAIDERMTAKQLYLKYMEKGIQLIKSNFANLINSNYTETEQGYKESSYYSKQSIDYGNIKIDLNQTAVNIKNQVRALNFRDYQLAKINGKPVVHVNILNEKSVMKPGILLMEDEWSFKYSTVDYNVVIVKDLLDKVLEYCETGNRLGLEKISSFGYDMNDQDTKGRTPLIAACCNGNVETAAFLVECGADVNKSDYTGITPLIYAEDYCIRSHRQDKLAEFRSILGKEI